MSTSRQYSKSEIKIIAIVVNHMRFDFPGKPISKKRPRFSRHGNKIITYSDPVQVDNEESIRVLSRNQINNSTNNLFPIEKGKRVELSAVFSISSKDTGKPDIVNLVSQICDSLEKECYYNDSQIVALHVYKRKSDNPNAIVFVEEIQDKKLNKDISRLTNKR
jgi:Holliday junction resolvase RusA-like endonuclease